MRTSTLTSLLTNDIEAALSLARRNSLTRDNPALSDLPARFESLRDHQRVAVREVLLAYEEGAECVVLDAPTGSGKSLIGEVVRRLLPDNRQTTYICSSKSLQDQVLREFDYAKVLKGRSNYATERYPERFSGKDSLSAADCTKTPGDSESCLWCWSTHACPYELAKSDALRSSLAVLNTSYFLSECNGPGRFSRGGLVIADEADTLESELMSHVEVRISERRLKQYGLGVPKYVTKEESWREWAEEAYEKVRNTPSRGRNHDDIQAIREQKRHTLLIQRLRGLRDGLASQGWVYTGDRSSVAFKPVTVDRLGPSKLWQHGDKWLLMSATVISADELLESLGWDEGREWRLVKVPSTFKAENRKVVIFPVANMSWKNKEEAKPKLVEGVKAILAKHPDDRILIHSVSYELTEYIVRNIGTPDGQYGDNSQAVQSQPGNRMLGMAGMEGHVRLSQSQVQGLPSDGASSELRTLGGADTSRIRRGSPVSSEALHQSRTSGGGNSSGEPEATFRSTDSLQMGSRIHSGQYLSEQGNGAEGMYRVQESPVQRMVLSYRLASEREGALADFLNTPKAILVAPSLDRGIDLPGDACRVQIVLKVPFLSLSDKQVSARLYGTGMSGRTWYAVNAIRTIVQMTGRAVRSEDDFAIAYILDRQFVDNVWGSHKRLIPQWWKEGLEWRMKGLDGVR